MMMPFHMKNATQLVRISILAGLILWMGFHVWVLTTYFQIDGVSAVWDSFVLNIVALGAVLIMSMSIPRLPKAGVFQFAIVLTLLLATAGQSLATQVIYQIPNVDASFFDFLKAAAPMRWAILFLIIGGSGLSLIFYARWNDAKEQRNTETSAQVLVREAELQKLQNQLQPHFLFNSLNSINALILIQPDRARVMVQQLSDFLRATLSRADERWITLDQEIAYLQLYLSIEKVRFGHRMDVQLDVDEQLKLWLIPPLLIQPLVENAIKFGLYGTTEKVLITMSTRREGDSLLIEISNPFDADMQPAEGSGFGLNGLRRRLYLLYTRNDLLKTTAENNRFTVQLTLPEKL